MDSAPTLILLLLVAVLAGCAQHPPMPVRTGDFSPVLPQQPVEKVLADGSIYSGGANSGLFGDRKAYRVGDIITIKLREKTFAEKSAKSSASRNSQNSLLSAAQIARLGSLGSLPLSSDSDLSDMGVSSEGSGTASQANQLGGDISATVVQVLSNGNLLVRGEKLIKLSHGDEYIQISGMIRADDVQPDNTVLSKRIANAEIIYSGQGELADVTRAGWGTQLFFKVWPF